MRSNLPYNSKQALLIAAIVALLPLGTARASDLYDSLKTWQKQSDEHRRDERQPEMPPPESTPAAIEPSGAQGPIRSETMDDQPATEPAQPSSDETGNRPSREDDSD